VLKAIAKTAIMQRRFALEPEAVSEVSAPTLKCLVVRAQKLGYTGGRKQEVLEASPYPPTTSTVEATGDLL
jgi:hypothetical protein